jgi:hypothetical protein
VNWFGRHVSTRVLDYSWAYRVRLSSRGRLPPPEFRDGNRRPLILLPGVYETWHFLEAVASRLHELGHPVHVIPGFGRNLLPIAEMAELTRRYLVDNDIMDVAVVAHSKGGLIGKAVMLTPEGAARVRCLVAINSPFSGSDYAHLVPIPRLREFIPTHETIVTLARNREVNARITSIYSVWDPIIPNGSLLEGATNIPLPVAGHFRLLDREDLLRAVSLAVNDS